MAINLKKNEGVDLRKNNRNITKLRVGLGWNANANGEEDFDLDASAFLLTANGQVRSEKDLVFYGALDHVSDSVHHMGDNLVGGIGEGRGDDEQITVDLSKIPSVYQEIVFTVTIYDWDVRNQNFGMVQNAYIRVMDESDPNKSAEELVRYDLTEDFSKDTAVIAGKISKENDMWRFTAIGESYSGGLYALCKKYNVPVLE